LFKGSQRSFSLSGNPSGTRRSADRTPLMGSRSVLRCGRNPMTGSVPERSWSSITCRSPCLEWMSGERQTSWPSAGSRG